MRKHFRFLDHNLAATWLQPDVAINKCLAGVKPFKGRSNPINRGHCYVLELLLHRVLVDVTSPNYVVLMCFMCSNQGSPRHESQVGLFPRCIATSAMCAGSLAMAQ